MKSRYEPSPEMAGLRSTNPLLTLRPRLVALPNGTVRLGRLSTHRSSPPSLPFRSEAVKSCNPSFAIAGSQSSVAPLTVGPRFCGAAKGDARLGLVAHHTSSPPLPPQRDEHKYSARLSLEMSGNPSQ